MTNTEKFPIKTVFPWLAVRGRLVDQAPYSTDYWSINLIVVPLNEMCTHILGYAVYILYWCLSCIYRCLFVCMCVCTCASVWRFQGTKRNVGGRLLVTGLQNTPRVEVVSYFNTTFASRVAFSSRVRVFSRNKSTCRLPCWKMFFFWLHWFISTLQMFTVGLRVLHFVAVPASLNQ